jgi:hypothetical protein
MAEPSNVTTLPTRNSVSVDTNNPLALYLDTGVFAQLQHVANVLSASSFVPKHLQNKPGDCLLVVAQAMRWRMDPLAVAQHTFVTQGKLGYEGKLIAAVVNASPKLAQTLRYAYSGMGDARTVKVTGSLVGDIEPREVIGTVKEWKTQNDKWAKMPDQMLAYRGAREWSRRHMPEAVLGVSQTDDEIPQAHFGPDNAIDITPGNPADLDAALAAEAAQAVVVTEPEPPAEYIESIKDSARGLYKRFREAKTQDAADLLMAEFQEELNTINRVAPDIYAKISEHFIKEQK